MTMEQLYELGRQATGDAERVDALFDALDWAARDATDRARLLWNQVCYAALFGRLDVVTRVVDDPDFVPAGDELRRAKLGGLLLELGRREEAERLLAASPTSLARYHLWRLAQSERLLGELPRRGPDQLLGRAASCMEALRAGDPGPARRLVAWWEGPAPVGRIASHLGSEVILVEVELHLFENHHRHALGAALYFVASPARWDASAILRATALLGPLARRDA